MAALAQWGKSTAPISCCKWKVFAKTEQWNMIQMKRDTRMFLIDCLAPSSLFTEMHLRQQSISRYNGLQRDGGM